MIASLTHLASLSNLNVEVLKDVLKDVDSRYHSYLKPKRDKVTNQKIKNKEGKTKTRPINLVKDIALQRIHHVIFKDLKKNSLPDFVHGGIAKKSNITNAASHLGYKYHFITDLEKFYPSINFSMVKNVFVSLGYTPRLALKLAILTTHGLNKSSRNEAFLPQGTQTSPAIANLFFTTTDKKLAEFCKSNNIVYTRFVDDLTFSSNTCFEDKQNELIGIILSSGVKISRDKTHYKVGDIEITGVKVFRSHLYFTKGQLDKINYLIAHPKDSRSKNVGNLFAYGKQIKKVSKETKKILSNK